MQGSGPDIVCDLQTPPSSIPPTALSHLHCSPGAPTPNTLHISLSSDLANFR